MPVKLPVPRESLSFAGGSKTIEEYTTRDPVVVAPDTKVEEVIAIFRKFRFRHLPVVKDGKAVGIISDRDILLARPMGVAGIIRAAEVMTSNPYAVEIDAPLDEVAQELAHQKLGSALVFDKAGNFYGIFTATDALNALVELLRNAK
jgi:acetoin utilization protein AcuB